MRIFYWTANLLPYPSNNVPEPYESHTIMSTHLAHTALPLALSALLLGSAIPANAAGEVRSSANGLNYGPSAATETACKASKLATAADRWIEANGVSVETGDWRRLQLSFIPGVSTDAFHIAMNEGGSSALALVEIQDADGGWRKVWEGQMPAPAAGFGQACFERQLEKKQVVRALRFTFRNGRGGIDVNHAALLGR